MLSRYIAFVAIDYIHIYRKKVKLKIEPKQETLCIFSKRGSFYLEDGALLEKEIYRECLCYEYYKKTRDHVSSDPLSLFFFQKTMILSAPL